MIRNLKKGLALSALLCGLSAVPTFAAGWTYNNNGQQVYQNDDGSFVTNSWIKSTENGNTVWYYATSNGGLRKSGWQQIGGYYYYFDDNGVMQTGWVDNENYYCDENGVMKTGWRQLAAPESYTPDDNQKQSETYWFYLNPSTGEKFHSNDGSIKTRSIDGIQYGFDEYGIMQTGWTVMDGNDSDIKSYMYFAEQSDSNFSYGQRVSSTWLSIVGPEGDDDLSTGDVEWFYFKADGYPAAGSGDYGEVVKVNGKRYLFNSQGNPLYGIQKDEEGNFYYCGTSKSDCSVRTGKITATEDDGDKHVCYFGTNGKGVTGIKDGLVYYKGKLQKADADNKYVIITASGTSIDGYVIDTNGKQVKNRKNLKDKNGVKFAVDASGNVTYPDGGTLDTLDPEDELLETNHND